MARTPLLPGSPYGPRRKRAEKFYAFILLAPKAPKQNFACQPQTLEGGEEGGGGLGGGTPPILLRCRAVLIHHCPAPGMLLRPRLQLTVLTEMEDALKALREGQGMRQPSRARGCSVVIL